MGKKAKGHGMEHELRIYDAYDSEPCTVHRFPSREAAIFSTQWQIAVCEDLGVIKAEIAQVTNGQVYIRYDALTVKGDVIA